MARLDKTKKSKNFVDITPSFKHVPYYGLPGYEGEYPADHPRGAFTSDYEITPEDIQFIKKNKMNLKEFLYYRALEAFKKNNKGAGWFAPKR